MRFHETFGDFAFIMKARVETMRDLGPVLSPFNAFLFLQGLETLCAAHGPPLRERPRDRGAPARASARRLGRTRTSPTPRTPLTQPATCPGARARSWPSASRATATAGRRFIEACELFSHLANVGDAKIAGHPPGLDHAPALDDERPRRGGVTPDMIRLSVGLEDVDDIIWDIDQALERSA